MSDNVNINVSSSSPVVKIGVQAGVAVPGGGGTGTDVVHVYNETPAGAMNGANATFTSAFAFVPETLEVFANGMKLKIVDEYNSAGNNTITLAFSPASNERLLINYVKL